MRRFRADEHGFSLIELMVALVILGILVAIALPVFLGVRRSAQETAAKDAAVKAVKTAKGFATDEEEDFQLVTSASLHAAEPSVTFLDGDLSSSGPTEVSQTVPDAGAGAQIFVAAVQSMSGECFYARTLIYGGTDFGRVVGTDCRAGDHGSVVFVPSW